MITGMASAVAPARKSGVRKFTRRTPLSSLGSEATEGSSHLAQALARGQIGEQRTIERLARIEERIVDPLVTQQLPERLDVGAHDFPILFAEILGNHRHLLAGLQIDEAARVDAWEFELARIEALRRG